MNAATFTGGMVNSAGGLIASTHTGIHVAGGETFAGGISNAGTVTVSGGGAAVRVGGIFFGSLLVSGFSGGIANSGVLAAGGDAIQVDGVSSFSGGIVNSGSATLSAAGDGIFIADVGTFAGGISNAGTITAGLNGIDVCGCVSAFTGGISNSGTIVAQTSGILVDGVATFAGGISNSGTISAVNFNGIAVGGVQTFANGIANSGLIAANSTGISVVAVSNFSGGISNGGTIAVGSAGIAVAGVATFAGGISNSGTISASREGVVVDFSSTFSGGISNSGTIAAAFGPGIVVLSVDTFAGGISNSGTISAAHFSKGGGAAILVEGVSTFDGGIANSGTLVDGGIAVVSAETFLGGISNSGAITRSTAGKGFSGAISVSSVTVFGSASAGGGITNSGTISTPRSGIIVQSVGTFYGGISNAGTIAFGSTIFGTGIALRGLDTFLGGISNSGHIISGGSGTGIMAGFMATFQGGIANSGTIASGVGGVRILDMGSFGGGISNGGLIAISTPGSSAGISIDGVSLFTGGVHNTGTITGAAIGIDICGCSPISTFSGDISNSGVISAPVIGIFVGGISTFNGHIVNTGTITGGGESLDLTGAITAITIDQNAGLLAGDVALSPNGDTLNIRGGTISGNVFGVSNAGTVNFLLGSGSFTYAAPFAMTELSQVNFNSGTVFVDGSIQASTIDVNSSGTAAGTGTIAGAVFVNAGGTLMPGNPANQLATLNVTGSLTFNAGSNYAVRIAPGAGNNSSTAVIGNVAIGGGTVVVTPQAGRYSATNYVIVSTTGGVSGTFNPAVTVNGTFTGTMTLDYTTIPGDVLLDVSAGVAGQPLLIAPGPLSTNQQNVLNGINTFIRAGNILPPGFQNLPNLSGPALLNALTQLSGEGNVGFFQGAFQAGNNFLNLMVNPFLDGRFGSGGGFGAAMGFAADEPPALPQAAAAFASAMPVKATPVPATFAQRFSVWGAAYGGSGRVTGDPVLGSHDTTASAAAFAAGVDYRLSPDTTLGFALAGGGTSWNVTGNLGGGSSDMFQAGVYGSHRWGAAYLSGAIAYNLHDVTTNRTLTIAGTDMLQARFRANGVGARLEGGYRYATPWVGFTPYAAAQVQSIALPNYGETATAGSNQFAMNFASQTATTTRTELGAWLDRSTRMDSGALLTVYGRLAWAHDVGNTPQASAIFQALPGSNFVVNGAVPVRDGALATGAAQVSLANGWSFLAKFDGEFSSTTSIYSGSGMVKKTW